MGSIAAVESSEADPKAGKPRPQSDTKFPYYDLRDAVAVAKTIHEKAGGSCDRAQLAGFLGHKGVNSGAFLSRVSAAKMFGLIEQVGDDWLFRLTTRGKTIVAPVLPHLEDQARLDAFFAVELFQKVYDEFDGQTLPSEAGLGNLFGQTYGVVPTRVAPTVRIMMDSAEYAGLFKIAGRTRMIRPIAGMGAVAPSASPESKPPEVNDLPRNGGSGGGGGEGGHIDPAILGLLRNLPQPYTPRSAAWRKKLIDAFTHTIEFIYPDAEAEQ